MRPFPLECQAELLLKTTGAHSTCRPRCVHRLQVIGVIDFTVQTCPVGEELSVGAHGLVACLWCGLYRMMASCATAQATADESRPPRLE